MNQTLSEKARFHHMKDGTADDWAIIGTEAKKCFAGLHQRVLQHLQLLDGDDGGYAVDRLTHSLQAATLAYQDGKDAEYVVCALLHDIGDTLGPSNHADIAATILEPFISEANHWMVKHHAIFQGYYFFEHLGLDKNLRDQYRDHPHYARTLEFIEKYDAPAFDPDMETYPLSFFEPMLKSVFSRPQRSLYMSEDSSPFE